MEKNVSHIAIAHDVQSVERCCIDAELRKKMNEWREAKLPQHMFALMIKNFVLNDKRMQTLIELVQRDDVDVALVDDRPSLIDIFMHLKKKRYDEVTIRKALAKALKLRESHLRHVTNDVDDFVLQIYNKDNRVKTKRQYRAKFG